MFAYCLLTPCSGQITRLTAKLATDEYKEYRDDWKLLTLWIGANDICDCRSTTPESFEKYLTESLEQIKRDIPKTFVCSLAYDFVR